MSVARPFREVKLQWLQQLSCAKDLTDNARSVALYIVTTHLNGHTEKAWPSYQTIADATGKSVKTIQRAIRELETNGWFQIRRGNGIGHNTEYRPSAASILRASDAREKTDKVVTLYPGEGSEYRPARRSDMCAEGGQICPPNPENEKIYKPNPREDTSSRLKMRRAVPLVFVAESMVAQIEQWRAWLSSHSLPSLEDLGLRTTRFGKVGWLLPSYWPEDGLHSSRFALFRSITAECVGRASQASDGRSINPSGQFSLEGRQPFFSAGSPDCRAQPKLLADDRNIERLQHDKLQ